MSQSMYAVGQPGQMPRLHLQADEPIVKMQLEPGEVYDLDVDFDEDGRPVSKLLPEATSNG